MFSFSARLMRSFSPRGRICSLHQKTTVPNKLVQKYQQCSRSLYFQRSSSISGCRYFTQRVSPAKHEQYRALFKLFNDGKNVDSREQISTVLFSLGMDPADEDIQEFLEGKFELDKTLSYDDFVHVMELRRSPLAQTADITDGVTTTAETPASEAPKSWFKSTYITAKAELRQLRQGFQLLYRQTRYAWTLVRSTFGPGKLSPQDRRYVMQAVTDLIRLVPFAILCVAPGGAIAVTVVSKLFPDLLPSTFKTRVPLAQAAKQLQEGSMQSTSIAEDIDSTVDSIVSKLFRDQEKVYGAKLHMQGGIDDLKAFLATQTAPDSSALLDQLEALEDRCLLDKSKDISDLTLDTFDVDQANLMAQFAAPPYDKKSWLATVRPAEAFRRQLQLILTADEHMVNNTSVSVLMMDEKDLKTTADLRALHKLIAVTTEPEGAASKQELQRELARWLNLRVAGVPPEPILYFRAVAHQELSRRTENQADQSNSGI